MKRENKKTKRPSKRGLLKSLGIIALAYGVGLVLIYWPEFFITAGFQYPECFAYDFFPENGGDPGKSIQYFLGLIHFPLAILGFMIMAVTSLWLTQRLNRVNVVMSIIFAPIVLYVMFFMHMVSNFRIAKGESECAGYPIGQFIDLKLFTTTEILPAIALILAFIASAYVCWRYLRSKTAANKKIAALSVLILVLLILVFAGRLLLEEFLVPYLYN